MTHLATRSLALAAAFVLGAGTMAGVATIDAPPAFAHAELVTTVPLEGELLAEVPAEVSLEWAEDLLDVGCALVVKGPDGTVVSDPQPTIDHMTISTHVSGSAGDGQYTVAYRIVSQDGHTVKGRYAFAVGKAPADATVSAEPGTALATPSASPGSSGASGASPTSASAAPAEPSSSAAPTGTGGQAPAKAGTSPTVILVVVAVVVIALLLAAIAVVRRRA